MEKDDETVTDIRDINPFVIGLRLSDATDLRKIKNTNYKLIDGNSKEVLDDNIVLAEERISDKTVFVKTYEEGAKAAYGMSKGAHDILEYIILRKLKFNNDVFDFAIDDYVSETDVSRSTTYTAINELQTKGIIAKRVKYPNTYYINPTMYYKGERRFLKMKYKLY